jgi:hypothetical protein
MDRDQSDGGSLVDLDRATLACLVGDYPGVEVSDDPCLAVRITLPDSPRRRHIAGAVKRALEDAGVDLATRGRAGVEWFEIFGGVAAPPAAEAEEGAGDD